MGGPAEIIGGILIALGAFFFVAGAIGIYRMPDVFTRMQAAGISDTVGVGLLLVGMMFFAGFTLITVKLAIVLGVILFTGPIATHALAQAALHAGVKPILADEKVLIGPGAHAVAAKSQTATKKPAARRRPATKKSSAAGARARKGRARS